MEEKIKIENLEETSIDLDNKQKLLTGEGEELVIGEVEDKDQRVDVELERRGESPKKEETSTTETEGGDGANEDNFEVSTRDKKGMAVSFRNFIHALLHCTCCRNLYSRIPRRRTGTFESTDEDLQPDKGPADP